MAELIDSGAKRNVSSSLDLQSTIIKFLFLLQIEGPNSKYYNHIQITSSPHCMCLTKSTKRGEKHIRKSCQKHQDYID